MLEKQHIGMALILLAGCHRQPRKIILPGSAFRLTELTGRGVLLPPPLIHFPATEPLIVQFQIGPTKKKDCEYKDDLLAIQATGGNATLTLPSLNQWMKLLPYLEIPGEGGMDRKISTALTELETLESRGCLTHGSALVLRQLIRDAIPLRPGFGLYSAYGYGPGGTGLDLKPDLRLKVQRAYFVGEQRNVASYRGLTSAYFEPVIDSQGRTFFRQSSTEVSSEDLRPDIGQDLHLASAKFARPHRLYRLLFLTTYVVKGIKRSALVLGASTAHEMAAMEKAIVANPAMNCADLIAPTGGRTSCIAYDGDVTASAEVKIKLDGEDVCADFGSTIRTILKGKPLVRVLRNFQGRLMPVTADPSAEKYLLDLVLVGGDELYTK